MLRRILLCGLLSVVIYHFGHAARIAGKAWLAIQLIDSAWSATLLTGKATKPWPWADIAPVARLAVPTLGIDLPVLSGHSGEALAFGPGMLEVFNEDWQSTRLISGHRDTHFGFLRRIKVSDALKLQTADGVWREYRVSGIRVVDHRNYHVTAGSDRLVLSTCYPFDRLLPGGHLRYVVEADSES